MQLIMTGKSNEYLLQSKEIGYLGRLHGLLKQMADQDNMSSKISASSHNSWSKFTAVLLALLFVLSIICSIAVIYTFTGDSGEVQNLSPQASIYKLFVKHIQDKSLDKISETLNQVGSLDGQAVNNTGSNTLSQSVYLGYSAKSSYYQCHSVPINLRFDCFPTPEVTKDLCEKRGCCWLASNEHESFSRENVSRTKSLYRETKSSDVSLNIPYCFYPSSYSLYNATIIKDTSDGMKAKLTQIHKSGFPNDIPELDLEVHYETCSRARIRILDSKNRRWETPLPVVPAISSGCHGSRLYSVYIDQNSGHLTVFRKNNSVPLFDTRIAAPLIYSDQYIQLSTILPSPFIYGLGQHLDGLLLDLYWKRKIFWNADGVPNPQANLYGSHPFYMGLEASGLAYGVFLLNSNAMDIILQPAPGLTFRMIGGIIDLYIFLGSSPDLVMDQYTEVIGRPFLPPYWSLGYQQCRFGYKNLENLEKVWKRTRDAKIPIDVQWSDIDYMKNQNDFTMDNVSYAGLPKFVDKLHELGMHYVIMVDPGISAGEEPGSYFPYELGIEDDIFIKNSTDQIFVGKVWNPTATVFPDFTLPRSLMYWSQLIQMFRKELAFDGLWIDMNEPANFWNGEKHGCPKESSLEYPYYIPSVVGGILAHKTLCATAKQFLGSHYNVHNLYGISEAIATYASLMMTEGISDPFIISRSSFPGLGTFAGHWTGDVVSDWFNLRKSVADVLTTGMMGIPMVGADICGFNGNTTTSLCNRWMQLGAFYPFSRNHNTDTAIDQDPVAMGELVVNSSRKALKQRYTLLPFLYTLFYNAHITGAPVAQPLFFRNPDDIETYSIDTQFLWGKGLMILPVLYEGSESVLAYFPQGKWYDWYTGELVSAAGREYLNISAPLDTIPVVLSGGSIIPCQDPGNTTTESLKNPFGLIVALDSQEEANGTMVYGRPSDPDFVQWKFNAVKNHINSNPCPVNNTAGNPLILGWMKIYGLSKVNFILINEQEVNFTFSSLLQVVEIPSLSVDFKDNINLSYY